MQKRPILVIDDDPVMCALVDSMLSGADFEVLSAPDAPSGLELARAAQPTVIVLDMLMPDMDGISTLQALKQDPVLKDIPVIGMTASADLTYTAKAFYAGAQFFLPKPFSRANLLHVVELAADVAQRHSPMHRRRRHPRLPAEVAVRCSIYRGAETTRKVTGQTGNISLGGLLLLLSETVSPGTAVQLGLDLPEGPITAKGTVKWQNPQPVGDGRFHHGVQLMRFGGDSSLLQYRRFLGQIAATSPA